MTRAWRLIYAAAVLYGVLLAVLILRWRQIAEALS